MTRTARRAPLALLVRSRLRMAGAEAVARLRHQPPGSWRCPSLRQHAAPLAEAAAPLLLPYFVKGGHRAARQILREVVGVAGLRSQGRAGAAGSSQAVGERWLPAPRGVAGQLASHPVSRQRGTLALPALRPAVGPEGRDFRGGGARLKMGALPLLAIFDALHPLVGEAVRALAFAFANSTLDTLRRAADAALGLLRQEIYAGLSEGESHREMTRRVRQIFDDPHKAETIARTEAQRALYSGEVMAARRSGVVKGLRWLAAPACCDVCQALDGKEVPLGAPFATGVGKNPAYSTVFHPPYHVNCRCSVTHVLDPRYLP